MRVYGKTAAEALLVGCGGGEEGKKEHLGRP